MKLDENEKIKTTTIDFKHQTTEAGWRELTDRFYLTITPKWFQWISWVFTLGVLKYINDRTHHLLVGILLGLSQSFLFLYFVAVFYHVDFKGFYRVKSKRATAILSALLSFGLTMVFSWAGRVLADIVKVR